MKRKLAAVFLAAALVVSGGSMAWAAEGEEDAGQVNIEERTDSNVKKNVAASLDETETEIVGERSEDAYSGTDVRSEEDGNLTARDIASDLEPAASESGDPEPVNPGEGTDTITETDANGLTWTLTDGVVTISGSGETGESPFGDEIIEGITSVVIEDGVTGIGNHTFEWYTGLRTVAIPGTVTEIGEYAFRYCASLSDLAIPNSVTKIGNHAFNRCRELTTVTIPNSMTEIGEYVFYGCISLESVSIPSSIVKIGAYAFYGCSNLSALTIPNKVTRIAYRAFAYCGTLPEVTLPSSVKSVGDGIFAGCTGLKKVTFDGEAPEITFDDRVVQLEPFEDVTAIAYCTIASKTWTEEIRNSLGSKFAGWVMPKLPATPKPPSTTDKVKPLRIIPEVTDNIYIIGSGEGATIKCTGELKDFVSVHVDGEEVDRSNYTLKEGSTVLTFLSKYLDTLSVGKHKVTMNYTYGSVDTELNVLAKTGSNTTVPGASGVISGSNGSGSANGSVTGANRTGTARNVSSPKTGDQAAAVLWMLIAVFSTGIGVTAASRRRNAA